MPSLFRRKQQERPRNEPERNNIEEALSPLQVHGNKARAPISRHISLMSPLLVLIIFFCLYQLRADLAWMYKNRYIYVSCPEYKIWLRKPNFYPIIAVRYVTAKFGRRDHQFGPQVQKHMKKVLASGVFATNETVALSKFPRYMLDDSRWKSHLAFLQHSTHKSARGGGYWFWKPLLVLHEINNVQEGDFIVYGDADRVDFVSWTALLLETMLERHADLAMEQMEYLERDWTKGDIYNATSCGLPSGDNSQQYTANFMVLRKNQAAIQFLRDWIGLTGDYHLLSDERSVLPNAKTFVQNRHDQSLLSMLLKCAYKEPDKQAFKYTCLKHWTLYTFRLNQGD
jgi:hypothetical protein